MTEVRPMTVADVEGVVAVVEAANEAADRAAGREPEAPTAERRAYVRRGTERFVERDGGGAWVAVSTSGIVGMAEAIRREGFWGLSMLFVHPSVQGQGIGRRLLDATLGYAEGSTLRMILTSHDPRALRRYALAGLAIHPAVEAGGKVDRAAIPTDLPGRSGDASDLDLVAEVDAGLRGSRAEDVEFMLRLGARMEVVDGGAGRGFAVYRGDRLGMLGATDEATAKRLLWRVIALADEEFEIWGLTAAQDWAVQVALAARLRVVASGPLFMAGRRWPPGPWLPSGWFF